jgi:C1A family cysteine protease
MRFNSVALTIGTLTTLLAGCGTLTHGLASPSNGLDTLNAESTKTSGLHGKGCILDGLARMAPEGLSLEAALPTSVDLRDGCSPVRDQGQTEGCVAFATACGLGEFLAKKNGRPQTFSPRFLWALTRKKEHSLGKNVGTAPADAVKIAREIGFVPEADFPMEAGILPKAPTFDAVIGEAPSTKLVAEAHAWRLMSGLQPVNTVHAMKQTLANGLPLVFAIAVLPSFEKTGPDGMVALPGADEKPNGGHALTCVGYNNEKQVFIVRNSWGANWGDHGYCYMPYAYVHQGVTCMYAGFTAKL